MRHRSIISLQEIIRPLCLMISFFCAESSDTQAQTYYFERYGAEEGLNSSKVYIALQDSRDYIWLGTDAGVSRFDGSKFENFSVDNGIAPGGVRSMCEDSIGRIWFGHLNGGISYYDGGRFVRAVIDDEHIMSDITSIRQHREYLWITTNQNGAMRLNFPDDGDTVLIGEQYHGSEGLSDMVFGSYTDRKGNLYCITDLRGIRIYLPGENRFESFSPPGMTREWQLTTMLEDSRGNFWFGTHMGGLYKMEVGSNEAKVFDRRDGLARNWITCLAEDYKGNIWVGTNGEGITVFSGDRMKNYNVTNGLAAMQVFSIMEDREKNIIITDYATGFSIYKGDHIYTVEGEDILAGNAVYAVQEGPDGKIWLGTDGGISVFDPDVHGVREKVVYNNYNSAIGDQMRFLAKDKTGTIWIGSHGKGVSFYMPGEKRFRWDSFQNSVLWSQQRSDLVTKAIVTDHNGNLWFGTNEGLCVWYPESWEGFKYSKLEYALPGDWITALFCDSKGNIWIGTESKNSLTKHKPVRDPAKAEFTVIDLGEDYKPGAITETADGRIWVGTESGLIALKDDRVELKLTDKDGLLSSNIKQLLADGDYLYIGTNRGLNRYHPGERVIATFTRRNGFTGIEATPGGSFRDSRGRLWFGTTNGAVVIEPEKYPPLIKRPLTHLSSMMVNNKPRKMTDNLKLSFSERAVSFDYYSVCVTNPDAVSYKVKLDGADDTWRPVTNQTTAYYSGLNPGHYTFNIMASNSYGYWDESPVTYSFTIRPPFYRTPWFMAIVVVFIIAMTALYIKMREMNLIKEKLILEGKVRERTAEVVQKSLIIEEKNRDITASIRYAERIQRAMLPPEDLLPETFIFFRPKDIVSGDFYWLYDSDEYSFIAAVDCTGHGVPGAFMSIIGFNSLNKIVREYSIVKPSAILDQLNVEVVNALLARHETTISDGMDLSLAAFNKKTKTLEYAGAYNPLYLVRNGEITVYKANRFPIGMSTMEGKRTFTNVEIDIQPGDMIYMSSDGYADQFGGPDESKYMSARFKKLLTDISGLPVGEQKSRLEAEILAWKGDLSQVDDILVIGSRIT